MSETDEQIRKIEPTQWRVAAVIAAFAAGAFLYKLLMHEQLGHSAAMFLGIPVVLAILLALAPRAKTATGGILKGITLALLVVAPLLGEGYLCILMASPLFYVVGLVVGLAVTGSAESGTLLSVVWLCYCCLCALKESPRS